MTRAAAAVALAAAVSAADWVEVPAAASALVRVLTRIASSLAVWASITWAWAWAIAALLAASDACNWLFCRVSELSDSRASTWP